MIALRGTALLVVSSSHQGFPRGAPLSWRPFRASMSAVGGGVNRSTQHLLILPDEEVCVWRGMHGHGSRRSRRLSAGSAGRAGRAVNVWRAVNRLPNLTPDRRPILTPS